MTATDRGDALASFARACGITLEDAASDQHSAEIDSLIARAEQIRHGHPGEATFATVVDRIAWEDEHNS